MGLGLESPGRHTMGVFVRVFPERIGWGGKKKPPLNIRGTMAWTGVLGWIKKGRSELSASIHLFFLNVGAVWAAILFGFLKSVGTTWATISSWLPDCGYHMSNHFILASWLWVQCEQLPHSDFLTVGTMWAATSFWLPDCGYHVSSPLMLASWLWMPHEQLPHAPKTLTSLPWWTPCSQKQIFLPVTSLCEVFGFSHKNGNWYRVGNLARDIKDVLFSFLWLWWNLKGGIWKAYSALSIYVAIFHWKESKGDSV